MRPPPTPLADLRPDERTFLDFPDVRREVLEIARTAATFPYPSGALALALAAAFRADLVGEPYTEPQTDRPAGERGQSG